MSAGQHREEVSQIVSYSTAFDGKRGVWVAYRHITEEITHDEDRDKVMAYVEEAQKIRARLVTKSLLVGPLTSAGQDPTEPEGSE